MTMIVETPTLSEVKPLCPIFGECGGCQYQNISYGEELRTKEAALKEIFNQHLKVDERIFAPIVASPNQYHYRNRIDLRLVKTKTNEVFMGFSPGSRSEVIPAESCSIALPAISQAIPKIKQQVEQTLPPRYRNANVVVRTGDDGQIRWGGIGRRSLVLASDDYLWTKINGKKIFYSLDTFFQANLSILPLVIEQINALGIFEDATFLDLYGGVGFFGLCLADQVRRVMLIEENVHSLKVAYHNIQHNQLNNMHIIEGRVEERLNDCLASLSPGPRVAMIDPPRAGLSSEAREIICAAKNLNHLLYLSCHPETLARDLKEFLTNGWEMVKIIPFDFFPRTKHIETLVLLKPKN
jgi:23S rRNA (uracil1939-C5)-methyltransferase/tRNA (uracil-5-)-methyltransferase